MTTPTTITSLPASASSVPQPYVVTSPPRSDVGVLKWTHTNLKAAQIAISQAGVMTPQSATSPPANPQDGMQRLARAPWCPITAGVTNVWVFYDITANSGLGGWVAL